MATLGNGTEQFDGTQSSLSHLKRNPHMGMTVWEWEAKELRFRKVLFSNMFHRHKGVNFATV